MYKESNSDSHVVSTSNNQGRHGVTNKTIITPTSGICKTQDDIVKRLLESRSLVNSDNIVMLGTW